MKKVFVLVYFVVLHVGYSSGQQVQGQGLQKNKQANKSMIAGHFDIDKKNEQRGITEHINVNYALSPLPFNNLLNLELSTANPLMFRADIVDAKGSKLLGWAPRAKDYKYNEAIDISKLAPGSYKVNVYSEMSPALLYSIPFQKEAK